MNTCPLTYAITDPEFTQWRSDLTEQRVAPAFELVNEIMTSVGAWQEAPEVEMCQIFLTILPQIGGEENFSLCVAHEL